MVKKPYLPDAGHIIWLQFDPQAGREQAGRRPALVLSPAAYNNKTSLAILCPITSKSKGYPFEVPLAGIADLTGVVLSDHVKSVDWQARNAKYHGTVTTEVLKTVRSYLSALIGV